MNERLLIHSRSPLNAEPELGRLRVAFQTAQADLYIRCHGPIPAIDPSSFRLRVGGAVERPTTLSLAELRDRFAPRTVLATLQCAGNRRADLQAVEPTGGDPWAPGAIGNAAWHGVALADLLAEAGVARGDGLHVAFEALDEVDGPDGPFRFGVSIPLAKALAPETLLAFGINGEPLAPAHGFPLRVITPGFAGVRSPKWVCSVVVQDHPSANPIQSTDYMLFPPGATTASADPGEGLVINEMPLNSAICEPSSGARLEPGPVAVRGYAIATGRPVARVDVSADDGATWRQARLEPDSAIWSWTLWEAALDLPPGRHTLAVRAWDGAGQTQPAQAQEVWNHKGYLSAAWHRVAVDVA